MISKLHEDIDRQIVIGVDDGKAIKKNRRDDYINKFLPLVKEWLVLHEDVFTFIENTQVKYIDIVNIDFAWFDVNDSRMDTDIDVHVSATITLMRRIIENTHLIQDFNIGIILGKMPIFLDVISRDFSNYSVQSYSSNNVNLNHSLSKNMEWLNDAEYSIKPIVTFFEHKFNSQVWENSRQNMVKIWEKYYSGLNPIRLTLKHKSILW